MEFQMCVAGGHLSVHWNLPLPKALIMLDDEVIWVIVSRNRMALPVKLASIKAPYFVFVKEEKAFRDMWFNVVSVGKLILLLHGGHILHLDKVAR